MWLPRNRRPASLPRRIVLGVEALEQRTVPASFLVTTAVSAGPGSLRQAILDANAEPGRDTIAFDIAGGGVQTIEPIPVLPTVTDPVILDATTQPGYAGTPLIELRGPGRMLYAHYALDITAGDSVVRGFVINGYDDYQGDSAGIILRQRGGNVIAGNYLGVEPGGTRARACYQGIRVEATSSGNVVGGLEPEDRNVISGSTYGIALGGRDNLVVGNFIGTDPTGTAGVFGSSVGIDDYGWSNRIGGSGAARNVLSGNSAAVRIFGEDTVVQGNLVGTDVTGTVAVPNYTGIEVAEGARAFIGGTEPGEGNVLSGNSYGLQFYGPSHRGAVAYGNLIGTDVTGTAALGNRLAGVFFERGASGHALWGNLISGNLGDGVLLRDANTTGNWVWGNLIGVDATGAAALPNLGHGVSVIDASGNEIGGTLDYHANWIAFNGGDGVRVDRGTRNAIRRNAIAGHGGLGIRLLNGGNNDQPAPEITRAGVASEETTLEGTLTGAPGREYVLEFFGNWTCNPSGRGEGGSYFGTLTVTTDGDGVAYFQATFPTRLEPGQYVTGTATDGSGNTSAFSACTEVEELTPRPSNSGFGEVAAALVEALVPSTHGKNPWGLPARR